MTPKDIFIQAVGFLGTILFFLSYQCRKNKNLFRVQFASYVCYTTHLLMLGAVTGGISYILNTVRSFCLGSQNAFLKGKRMCAIICALQVVTLCLTWENWWSVLPVGANIAATIGGYTYNGQKIRAAGMFVNSPLWIVYDIIVGSWAGVLDEIVTEASMIISICRYGWKNLDSTEN
jgi:NAD/NADP transhydrogenase beta subunit